MSDTVIVGLLGFAGTCVGAFIGAFSGIVRTSQLVVYRLEQLEKKVQAHNGIVERTYKLEGRMTEAEHDLRDLKGGYKA